MCDDEQRTTLPWSSRKSEICLSSPNNELFSFDRYVFRGRSCRRTSPLPKRRANIQTICKILGEKTASRQGREADNQLQLSANHRRRKDLSTLPLADRALLDDLGYKKKLQEVDEAILANAKFLNKIVENPEIFGHDVGSEDGELGGTDSANHPSSLSRGLFHVLSAPTKCQRELIMPGKLCSARPSDPRKQRYNPTEFDMDKLRSTLKLFVRDWSHDVGVLLFPCHHVATCLQGKPERDACYEPMKEALMTYFEGKNRCVSISSIYFVSSYV